MNIRWVVQSNLGKTDDVEEILNACNEMDIEFIPQKVVPFSDELPDIPNDKPTIFYGATNWINTIYESKRWDHIFFNPASTFDNWIEKYGTAALNHGARITTLDTLAAELDDQQYHQDELLFIRPLSDQKEFAGQVISAYGIWDWMQHVQTDIPEFGATKIAVTKPVGIEREWRCFMVNGRVSSGSQYRRYHKLETKCKVPREVIKFAEAQAKVYSPSPVFVMDVGRSADNLYVIEVGCFHSAGFYDSKIHKIVKDVSEYVIERC